MLQVLQLRLSNDYSYIVYDDDSRQAAIVDPVHGLEDLLEMLLEQEELKLQTVIETHTSWERRSAARVIHNWWGVETRTLPGPTYNPQPLTPGELILLGEHSLRIVATPGVSPECAAIVGKGFVLTGPLLPLGQVGRLGLPGSDAQKLFESLAQTFALLSDDTVLYPSQDCSGLLFSTLGFERDHNPWLKLTDWQSFAARLTSHQPFGTNFEREAMHKLNLIVQLPRPDELPKKSCGCVGVSAYAAPEEALACIDVPVTEASHALQHGLPLVDVREQFELLVGEIPGAESLAMSTLGQRYHCLDKHSEFHVLCAHGNRSASVALTLRRLGYAASSVTGGLSGWREAGLPVQ